MPASSARAAHKRSPSRRPSAQRPKAQQPAQAQRASAARSSPATVAPAIEVGGVATMNRATAWVGAVAATLTLIWTVWFTPTFALWMSRLPAWAGIEAYAAAFDPGAFLAWVIPCLLLPPTFVALVAIVDLGTDSGRRVWSRMGLIFGLLYAAILTTNYWLQYAVVMPALMAREFAGLSWFAIGNPLSVAGALEGLGYGAMGLATLFTGLSFDGHGDRQARAIRWLLVANGIAGFAGFLVGATGYMTLTFVALAIWCVTLPIAMVPLALRYARLARAGVRP